MTELDSDPSLEPPAPSAPGQIFAGRFAIEQVIGEGGSGIVYVARVLAAPPDAPGDASAPRLVPGTRVALKILHQHLASDPQVSRRFAREARILRGLDGEHVARLFDGGESESGELFLAMELLEGASLDTLAQAGPMAPDRAMGIVSQICQALEVAHAAGVVHRDLKPANVIVDARDGVDRVRVLDFGLAKILRGALQCSVNNLTQQNMVFGTPEYMAPEQARGDEVDERCDVYAAGIILYQLITGTLPFQAATPIATMSAQLAEEPEPPTRRAPQAPIPPALEGVVLHALAKRPELRYPTATDLRVALESAAQRPDDVTSILPPPSRDELERRDTDPYLHMTASLRQTEQSLSASTKPSASAPSGELPRTVLWLALAAALGGVLLGLLMSLLGGTR